MKVHTNNILKTAAVAFAGTLLAAAPSFAASLTNGDFETAGPLNPETQAGGFFLLAQGQNFGPAGWTATTPSGGAAYLGNTLFSNNGTPTRSVQLNGGQGQGGIFTSVIGLVTNTSYNIGFDLSNNLDFSSIPRITVALANAGASQTFTTTGINFPASNFNGTPSGAFQTAAGIPGGQVLPSGPIFANLNFTRFVATFLYTGVSSTANLTFTSNSGTSNGPIIDNVTIANTTPVPFEFSPVTGFIAGGVLLGSYKLIKSKKSVA